MLTCDENHVYTNEFGMVIPNVTTILQYEGFVDFSKVPKDVLAPAQKFGTDVHLGCYLSDNDQFDHEKADKEILPYVEAWQKFLDEKDAKVIMSENIVHSNVCNFCGRIDRVLEIKGVNGIYDIKTGAGCSLQTAAYKIALDEEYPELKLKERGFIKLSKTGYKFIEHKDKTEESTWKSIMVVNNSRPKYNKGAK